MMILLLPFKDLGETYSSNLEKEKVVQDLLLRYESDLIALTLLFPEITVILYRVYSSEKVFFVSCRKVYKSLPMLAKGLQFFFKNKIAKNIFGERL